MYYLPIPSAAAHICKYCYSLTYFYVINHINRCKHIYIPIPSVAAHVCVHTFIHIHIELWPIMSTNVYTCTNFFSSGAQKRIDAHFVLFKCRHTQFIAIHVCIYIYIPIPSVAAPGRGFTPISLYTAVNTPWSWPLRWFPFSACTCINTSAPICIHTQTHTNTYT